MKFFKTDPLEKAFLRLAENELYEVVTLEVMNEQVMPGIWGKAFSHSEGDMEKSKALYIKYRVQDLMDRAIVTDKINEISAQTKQTDNTSASPSVVEQGNKHSTHHLKSIIKARFGAGYEVLNPKGNAYLRNFNSRDEAFEFMMSVDHPELKR